MKNDNDYKAKDASAEEAKNTTRNGNNSKNKHNNNMVASPEMSSNFFSHLFLHWAQPLFSRASALHKENKALEQEDLLQLPHTDYGKNIFPAFEKAWDAQRVSGKPTLVSAIRAVIGRKFLYAGIIKLVNTSLQFSFPLILGAILEFMEDTQGGKIPSDAPWYTTYRGYWLSAVLFLGMSTKAITENAYFHIVYRLGYQSRVAISVAVYNKSLRLSSSARHGKTLGELTNLMQMDSTKIELVVPNLHVLWDGLYQIAGYMTILYTLIGWPCFAGLIVMVIAGPLQGVIMKKLFGINRKMVTHTDARVKTTNEAIQGIRCVKMYTWEDSFKEVIAGSRNQELKFLKEQAYLRGFSRAYMNSLPVIVAVVSFAVYAVFYEGATTNASTLFAAIVAFDQLRFPLLFYPMILALIAQAHVSRERIESFLRMEEIKMNDEGESQDKAENLTNGNDSPGTYKRKDDSLNNGELKVENVDIYWSDPNVPLAIPEDSDASSVGTRSSVGSMKSNKSSKKSKGVIVQIDTEMQSTENIRYPKRILGDVNLNIASGDLCAIIGSVGSGKTTLCSAFLNEAVIRGGSIGLKGSVAYAAQVPWVLNATLRDNITFGVPYEKEKYDKVVSVCQLTHDLDLLEFGDMTEIGENGINLSGGQKQRVSIARAAYSSADIFLFDDPLSALDPEVAKKVFEQCIVKLLKGKTRILATNQLQFLPQCDLIAALGKRRILEMGNFDMLSKNNGEVQRLLDDFEINQDSSPEDDEATSERGRSNSIVSLGEIDKTSTRHEIEKENEGLVTAEERNVGAVSWQVYKKYIIAGGGTFFFFGIIFIFLLCTAIGLCTTGWVSVWTSDANYDRNSRAFYLWIYALLAVCLGIFTFFRSLLLARFSVRASYVLHKNALDSVLRGPMSFFDTTPTGRILSRFSKDLYSIDLELSDSLDFLLFGSLSVVTSLVIIVVITPFFGLAILPLMVFYVKVLNYFREVSRETKRLESISRSPVFAHFSETLGGLGTIRSYGQTDRFINDFERKLDTNTLAYYNNKTADRWLSIRLELVGSVIAGLAAVFAVHVVISDAASGTASSSNFASLAGLSVSTAIGITGLLNWVVRMFAQTEAAMTAAERMLFYTEEIPQEAPSSTSELEQVTKCDGTFPAKRAIQAKGIEKPNSDWPSKGEITLNNLKMRYRPETPLVIKGLNLVVRGGERIGIVGRTGSGKSSLLLVLLRLVEPSLDDMEDSYDPPISIDGVDILRIGLKELREKIGIIPQDPVLFSGTIRSNMDPFNKYDDKKIWHALERCGMKDTVEALPGGLYGNVAEYGDNLSQGQKQLLCLGRSLLRKCRVLLLDEATSSVDYETDATIQRTLREDFIGCTILTIAHRVNTIMDSDKILVMDDGEVGEFGAPKELIADKTSLFADIVEHAQLEQN